MGVKMTFILINFIYRIAANVYSSNNVISCTTFNTHRFDNADNTIQDVYKCLDKTLIINLQRNDVERAIGTELRHYIDSLNSYEHQTIFVDETNKVTRHELTAIQQDAVTTLSRLKYITKNLRLPAAYRISNERLIEETKTFIYALKNTLSLIEAIPPLLENHIATMTNLTIPLNTLNDYEQKKSMAYEELDEAIHQFQTDILQKIH